MFLIGWLLVWALAGAPSFGFTFNDPSPWFIGLLVCIAAQLLVGD